MPKPVDTGPAAPQEELRGALARGLAGAGPGILVAANLLVAALYVGLGTAAGLFFARFGLFPSPIWLPAGIATTACLIGGMRLVPGLYLGALAVNHLLLEAPLATAGLIAVTNSLGPLAGAALTRALRPPTGLFTRLRGVLGFVAGSVLLHAALTGGGGTLALVMAGGLPAEAAYSVAANWILSDAGGVFFLGPALMLWLGAERTPTGLGHAAGPAGALVPAATAGIAVLVFALPPPYAALVQPEAVFLLTIPVTWVTLRISLRAAYTLLTLISVVATVGTLLGLGPLQPELVLNPLRAVGMMIVLMATNALALMALLSERREAEAWLSTSNARLTSEVAARTAELRHRAEADDLTGIANRGHFLRRLDDCFAEARRDGAALALVVVDLDHFRQMNDMRGHGVGDVALCEVARICTAQMDGWNAVFGRLGGEVFAAALPGTGASEAASLAESLRAAIARHGFRSEGAQVPGRMTASLGVTALLPGDAAAQDLLRRADAAVFLAKTRGRNRVELRLVSDVPQEMRASNLSR